MCGNTLFCLTNKHMSEYKCMCVLHERSFFPPAAEKTGSRLVVGVAGCNSTEAQNVLASPHPRLCGRGGWLSGGGVGGARLVVASFLEIKLVIRGRLGHRRCSWGNVDAFQIQKLHLRFRVDEDLHRK